MKLPFWDLTSAPTYIDIKYMASNAKVSLPPAPLLGVQRNRVTSPFSGGSPFPNVDAIIIKSASCSMDEISYIEVQYICEQRNSGCREEYYVGRRT